MPDLRRGLAEGGKVAVIGFTSVAKLIGVSLRGGKGIAMVSAHATAEDLELLSQLIQAGKVRPQIDRRYPFAEIPAAIAYLEQGHQRFYHGTKADLKPGDLIEPGYPSNFGKQEATTYVYLTGTLDAATWGAELALGEGPGRIYIVEPTGPIDG